MAERHEHLSEGFLVDGVAPSVIGGEEGAGPPIEEEYEDFRARREDFRPGTRTEPPTTPIPAQAEQAHAYRMPAEQQRADQRKGGWLGRVFGGRE
ncbi:MAG TPA: hypothetical protein VGP26_15190 [Actinophytocola sp.]|jgi:hypothetical protein|nr:hypothetical protein [Actinophytocola sp.]